MDPLPKAVMRQLRTASFKVGGTSPFRCRHMSPDWNSFVETWAGIAYRFVEQALGPYQTQPLFDILPLEDGMRAAGATASFNLSTGQIRLDPIVQDDPGKTLEKLTHELIHGSLASFPDDPFYDEGYVDYTTWVLSHAPVWLRYQPLMKAAAEYNINERRRKAFLDQNDYDRKRWAGGTFAMLARGPYIVSILRNKKLEGDFTW